MGSKVGIIGTGNMGGAILRGIITENYVRPSELLVYDASAKRMKQLSDEYIGLRTAADSLQVAEESDIILLCVKPNYIEEVIRQIRPALNGKTVVSIAAGWTLDRLEAALQNTGAAYMRVMPNTPAMVGEGMTAICDESTANTDDIDYAQVEALTKVGLIGIKVWICKGEVYGKRDLSPNVGTVQPQKKGHNKRQK